MHTAIGTVLSTVLGLVLLPVLLTGGDAPPPAPVCDAVHLPIVLETIREIESGGDYTTVASGSSASGAYQFLDTTWANFRGYPRAVDAPPEIQDAKATQHVQTILDNHDGDVTAVPVIWYLGHLPQPNSPTWDTIPSPGAGNTLTPRQYQTRWLNEYNRHLSTRSNADEENAGFSCSGGSIEPLPGDWSLPGPRHLIDANPAALTYPHHDYPAWDWTIPTNTPIYAIRGGTITNVHTLTQNWWDANCDTNTPGCDPCGIGLTITDNDRNQWTYCHGRLPSVVRGERVGAGRQLMWSGNSGRSSGPHLHLQVRTSNGVLRCPQALLTSLYRRTTPTLALVAPPDCVSARSG